jgi:PDZ domain-containing protein
MRNNQRYWILIIIPLLVFTALTYYPLPYYITQPGDAVELAPFVSIEEGYAEQGTFMLTTVRMGGANVISYGLARMNDFREIIPKEEFLRQFENEEEYTRYQLHMMQNSQQTAIKLAFELARKSVEVVYEGALVIQTVEDFPAEEHIRPGDTITRIDEQHISTSEELIQYLHSKQAEEEVHIYFTRDEREHEVALTLVPMPGVEGETNNDQPRAGIGIRVVTKQTLQTEPPIQINTSKIGGPSAGLMFTLEIYNQLVEEDITKGYRVAGTGTISTNGTVGRIGGVHQKVVAADRAQADIFFVPYEEGRQDSNYVLAQETAHEIGTSMKIVPVDTVYEALDYLASLAPHQAN